MRRSSGAARAPLAGAAAAVTMSTAAKAVVIGTAAAVAMGARAAMMGHATSFATDVQPAPNAAVRPSEVTVAGTF
ncbi:hypothetical protein L1080_002470 [Rhodococcus sp. MSC1_016]|uniref:hypothetical protein n=1 Tax=Rhodococcus sp. MSC1_016 TaxID=2909266 RepID=UPI00202FDF54|nr:hypothetical protein [Rhodococcus sp. MSC1_016]